MLKFIELWNGRKLINSINPMEMPITRKLLTLKWLQWVDNKISWQEMLF
jgi:3-deoxy-D-arabino-heptulosonate 7-phosphate (DAHP) synthase